MCGLVGFSGSFSPALLDAMNAAIAHRGPDDSGTWLDPAEHVGLAHRRLSIIDLSPLGHQPMWDAGKTAAIVFNGEIYNYRELRAELFASGATFRSESDTEVLLNLYLRDGTEMLLRLKGIFAFAIWDSRVGTLFIARDGFGIKPLYYAELSAGLLFASELKALLQEPSVPRTLNADAVKQYMAYLWCPAPATMLSGVSKLPPGHAMIVRNGRIERSWQYYDLPYHQRIVPITRTDAVREVSSLVREAVRRQMVADVPVGAFLSGGLDSSAVVAFAREFSDRKLQCFTIAFDDVAASEEGMTEDLPYAQRVAKHLGVDLHAIDLGPDMISELETMVYQLDEPQADAAPLNVLYISRLARAHGIKVLLSGAGGDDIFTGYRRHYALMQEKYWAGLPNIARRALRYGARQLPTTRPQWRRARKAFQFADLEGDERLASYFLWSHPADQAKLYGPLLARSTAHTLEPLTSTLRQLPRSVPPLNRMLYLEGKHFLADHNLNYTDKMAMAHGVEVRVPLLDPDLVAYAAQLPLDLKQRGSTGKWIFKKAMEPYLPHDVIYRPKTGFGAPLRRWLRHELRDVVLDTLSPSAVQRRGLFDPAGVAELVENDRAGRVDGSYTIFSLICIELWCRIFLDRSGSHV